MAVGVATVRDNKLDRRKPAEEELEDLQDRSSSGLLRPGSEPLNWVWWNRSSIGVVELSGFWFCSAVPGFLRTKVQLSSGQGSAAFIQIQIQG